VKRGLSGPALEFFCRGEILRGLIIAMLLAGCSSSVRITAKEPEQKLELVGVFIYPFAFRWDEPAYRSFELSQRMVDVGLAAAGDELSFWGPSEFKVIRPDDDAAWVATTALPQLTGTGARPDQAVVMRPWAEKRVNSSQAEAHDAKGHARGSSTTEETTYLVHLEVIHPATRERLLDLEGEVKIDPFAEAPPEADYDPAPLLTRLCEKLALQAVKKLSKYSVERQQMKLPVFALAMTPASALRWQDSARPPAELEMAKMDAASLDLFMQARAKFLNPKLSDLQVSKLTKLPIGLQVVAKVEDAKWQVDEGDLLMTIDDIPALPQVWSRLKFAPAPANVKVRRPTGEMVEVLLP
jgi:hypothetical protein